MPGFELSRKAVCHALTGGLLGSSIISSGSLENSADSVDVAHVALKAKKLPRHRSSPHHNHKSKGKAKRKPKPKGRGDKENRAPQNQKTEFEAQSSPGAKRKAGDSGGSGKVKKRKTNRNAAAMIPFILSSLMDSGETEGKTKAPSCQVPAIIKRPASQESRGTPSSQEQMRGTQLYLPSGSASVAGPIKSSSTPNTLPHGLQAQSLAPSHSPQMATPLLTTKNSTGESSSINTQSDESDDFKKLTEAPTTTITNAVLNNDLATNDDPTKKITSVPSKSTEDLTKSSTATLNNKSTTDATEKTTTTTPNKKPTADATENTTPVPNNLTDDVTKSIKSKKVDLTGVPSNLAEDPNKASTSKLLFPLNHTELMAVLSDLKNSEPGAVLRFRRGLHHFFEEVAGTWGSQWMTWAYHALAASAHGKQIPKFEDVRSEDLIKVGNMNCKFAELQDYCSKLNQEESFKEFQKCDEAVKQIFRTNHFLARALAAVIPTKVVDLLSTNEESVLLTLLNSTNRAFRNLGESFTHENAAAFLKACAPFEVLNNLVEVYQRLKSFQPQDNPEIVRRQLESWLSSDGLDRDYLEKMTVSQALVKLVRDLENDVGNKMNEAELTQGVLIKVQKLACYDRFPAFVKNGLENIIKAEVIRTLKQKYDPPIDEKSETSDEKPFETATGNVTVMKPTPKSQPSESKKNSEEIPKEFEEKGIS